MPVSVHENLPIAITIGEPAGIGPDVILLSWLDRHQQKSGKLLRPFYVIGDVGVLQKRAQQIGLEVPVSLAVGDNVNELFETSLPVIPLKNPMDGIAGTALQANSKGIVEAIETAVDHLKSGKARAMVTAPINKKSLYDAGFNHPGHTEFLAFLANGWNDNASNEIRSVMMLAGPRLRAVPITIHIPLSKVAETLTTDSIVEIASITANDLMNRFGISSPRLAIAGLNPHAGEEGAMGMEDQEIVAPAVAKLKSMGINAVGPLPADTMFHERARATYDVAICMYHDQALIPAKALDFDQTVNVTLGLPFVRTSPDHGTAFDIAGKGVADPSSMIAAIRMADEMSAPR